MLAVAAAAGSYVPKMTSAHDDGGFGHHQQHYSCLLLASRRTMASRLLFRSLLAPVFMPSFVVDFCSVVTLERSLDGLGAPKPTSSSVPGLAVPHTLHSVLRAELSVSHLSSGQFQLPGAGRRLFLDDRASF